MKQCRRAETGTPLGASIVLFVVSSGAIKSAEANSHLLKNKEKQFPHTAPQARERVRRGKFLISRGEWVEVTDWLPVRRYGCAAKNAWLIIKCFVFVRVQRLSRRGSGCARLRAGETRPSNSNRKSRERGELRAHGEALV